MREYDTKAEVCEELSVMSLAQAFPNNLAAEQWLERSRWPDKADIKFHLVTLTTLLRSPVGDLLLSIVVLAASSSRYGKVRLWKEPISDCRNGFCCICDGYEFERDCIDELCKELNLSQPTAWFLL